MKPEEQETKPMEESPARAPLWRRFLFPRLTRGYVLRVLALAVGVWLLVAYVITPCRVAGRSMEPSYANGSWLLCYRLAWVWREPRPGDVVMVRFIGRRVMLLKRVVALPGDTVAFVDGQLLVNGQPVDEPYVQGPCDWELPERTVKADHVYVVGDNRAMPMEAHQFGQARRGELAGRPFPGR